VFQALAPQVGVGMGGEGVSDPSLAPAAVKATIAKGLIVLVGVAGVGGALFVALRPDPPPASAPVVQAKPRSAPPARIDETPVGHAEVEVAEEPVAKEPAVEEQAAEKQVAKKAVVVDGPGDSLAQEVAILSRASAKLHGGQPAAALGVLAEHQRRFPRGVLAQERIAARVQALCALGRVGEAKSELRRLSKVSPNSPHEARARKACGSALDKQ
jgi:hypothetical protein